MHSPPPTTEPPLTSRAEAPAPDLFRTLVDGHGPWVFAAAYRQLRDRQLAEDSAQTVFILLFRRPHLMHSPKLSGWLFNTLQYTVKNLRRAECRRLAREAARAAHIPSTIDPTHPVDLHDQLDAAVARLSTTDRAAILLRFYQDLSFEQIAHSLNISESAAKKRVARAIASLRRHLNPAAAPVLTDASLALAALHAVPLAPSTLTSSIVTAVNNTTLPLAVAASLKGVTMLMNIAKLQTAALLAAAACVLLIPTTLLVVHAAAPAVPAIPAATTTPADDYVTYYALKPGESLKVVTAPPAIRAAMYTALQSPQNKSFPAPPGLMLFDWNNGTPQSPLIYVQTQLPLPQAVAALAALALHLKPEQIQLQAPLPATLFTLPGDIVYDTSLPPEQVLPALESLFQTRMNLRLKLSFIITDEKIYTLQGEQTRPIRHLLIEPAAAPLPH